MTETMVVRTFMATILATIVSHWIFLFLGSDINNCHLWFDDKEDNMLYDVINTIESIAVITATEGTIFIFEWYYVLWLGIHMTQVQKLNIKFNMRKVSDEERSKIQLLDRKLAGNGPEVNERPLKGTYDKRRDDKRRLST